jgi:uncharacterized protein HemX
MMLAVLILCAFTLAAALWLFVTLKREVWEREQKAADRETAAAATVSGMHAEIQALRNAFADLEDRTGMLTTPSPTRSGLNMGRRTQAVRMLRRGDNVEQVAASMGLPLNEARLLATVERLRASDPDRRAAAQ